MGAEPVFGHRALMLKNHALVVADLHIGVEYELEKKGIKLPSQWKSLADEIISMARKEYADILIINGDIKHGIPPERRELRDLHLFLRYLSGYFDEIHITKGNHDGMIERGIPEHIHLHGSSGFLLEGYGILHGHAWPREIIDLAHTLIIGHTHPTFLFVDATGNPYREPCWIRGRYGKKQLIVMPAMSRFYGGSPVNEGNLLGPILNSRDFEKKSAEIYLLDGTYVGKIQRKKEG